MKTLFPGVTAAPPTMAAALARIGDDGGLTEAESGTLSLSTPIVSTQDGPRMSGVSNIPAHRKAAPFRKGGKRRKAILAKDALKKAKGGGDYSNVDLAFRSSEPRDSDGKWTGGGLARKRALAKSTSKDNRSFLRKALGMEAKNSPISKEMRQALGLPRGVAFDPRAGSFSTPAGDETDLAFRSSEKRDHDGKWAKGGPTWLPEKGARSQAEFDMLQAKNARAQAALSKSKSKPTTASALEDGRKIVDGYGTPQAKQDALGAKVRAARAAFEAAQKGGSAHEVRKANRRYQRAAKHDLFHAKKFPGVKMSGS